MPFEPFSVKAFRRLKNIKYSIKAAIMNYLFPPVPEVFKHPLLITAEVYRAQSVDSKFGKRTLPKLYKLFLRLFGSTFNYGLARKYGGSVPPQLLRTLIKAPLKRPTTISFNQAVKSKVPTNVDTDYVLFDKNYRTFMSKLPLKTRSLFYLLSNIAIIINDSVEYEDLNDLSLISEVDDLNAVGKSLLLSKSNVRLGLCLLELLTTLVQFTRLAPHIRRAMGRVRLGWYLAKKKKKDLLFYNVRGVYSEPTNLTKIDGCLSIDLKSTGIPLRLTTKKNPNVKKSISFSKSKSFMSSGRFNLEVPGSCTFLISPTLRFSTVHSIMKKTQVYPNFEKKNSSVVLIAYTLKQTSKFLEPYFERMRFNSYLITFMILVSSCVSAVSKADVSIFSMKTPMKILTTSMAEGSKYSEFGSNLGVLSSSLSVTLKKKKVRSLKKRRLRRDKGWKPIGRTYAGSLR